MSSSSKFTLARLFSIESSELIHKLSKDFSEDRTAAIFGNPTYLHRGERKLFKKSAHEDYHFSTIISNPLPFSKKILQKIGKQLFLETQVASREEIWEKFRCLLYLTCSMLTSIDFDIFFNLSASRYVVYFYGPSPLQTFKH